MARVRNPKNADADGHDQNITPVGYGAIETEDGALTMVAERGPWSVTSAASE